MKLFRGRRIGVPKSPVEEAMEAATPCSVSFAGLRYAVAVFGLEAYLPTLT
jgi:hypothetical protein